MQSTDQKVPDRFAKLEPYPFAKLATLTAGCPTPKNLEHIPLSLGEPKHSPPDFVVDYLADRERLRAHLATYPATKGSEELRASIANWLQQRFATPIDSATQVLPVAGTREALFSFAQAMLSGKPNARVLMPNPFYQIYEGASLLGNASPYFVNNDASDGYQQNFEGVPTQIWADAEIVYLCTPGNPTGQIMSTRQLQQLIELAHKHNFIIASDECYSEIYLNEAAPPTSLLAASEAMGNRDYERCVVFHSLSKRSNLPGLRSGFVAGDAQILNRYFNYRTYHGCAMSAHHQAVSALAWSDENHVFENRKLYQRKFAVVEKILAPHFPIQQPAGGFYHWLQTPIDELEFAKGLLSEQNVTVMPGSYLARADNQGNNPGTNHVRVAWVARLEDCQEAASRMVEYVRSLD
ncbi:MAG: succinyldiaminopimelate transaminase [Pseudomonadota bacterium]